MWRSFDQVSTKPWFRRRWVEEDEGMGREQSFKISKILEICPSYGHCTNHWYPTKVLLLVALVNQLVAWLACCLNIIIQTLLIFLHTLDLFVLPLGLHTNGSHVLAMVHCFDCCSPFRCFLLVYLFWPWFVATCSWCSEAMILTKTNKQVLF